MLHTDNPHESLAPAIHLGVTGTFERNADLGISTWCIFDNTALGAATADALAVRSLLLNSQRAIR